MRSRSTSTRTSNCRGATVVEPPSHLPPAALPAWKNVTERVAANGWEDIYLTGYVVIASHSSLYLDCVKLYGPQHETTREAHMVLRQWMHDYGLVDEVMNVRYDDLGRDVE